MPELSSVARNTEMESEEAALFRAACHRHGIDASNSEELLGIKRSQFYANCNGSEPVSKTVKRLLDSKDEALRLKETLRALESGGGES